MDVRQVVVLVVGAQQHSYTFLEKFTFIIP